jgi:hypothetical protein
LASRQADPVIYTGLRGRDGSTTAQIEIPEHKAKECLNVDFFQAALARKRGGATDAFALTTSENTSSVTSALIRHVPSADETLAELWMVTGAATPIVQRLAAGTAWASITVGDAIATRPQDVWGVSFNGKLFLFYDSTQDRGHVYDPAISTTALRRTGLTTPSAAPTVANTGSGSYAATQRWYRVREVILVSSVTVLISEASAAVAFTPSGSGTAARVTKPSDMGEGATHWRLEASATSSDGPFYILATTVVGTTTYDDSAATTAYSNGTPTEVAGDYTRPSSFKYGIADGARLLMAGPNEAGIDPSSVFFTTVLGSSRAETGGASYYDDERVPTSNKIPLDPKDGGEITGFGGPFENQVIAFKYRQVWRLIPTGIEDDPYRRKAVSKVVGSIRQQAVVMAEDESGNPTLYWLSHLGPYRFNLQQGLSKLVWDVQDIWSTVNLAATTATCHGVYHSDRHQIWWWVSVSAENEPTTTKLVFDTRLGRMTQAGDVRDGWSKHTGETAKARCSVMFANTLGATVSRDLKPYIGQNGGNGRLWKLDTTDQDDAGTAFQGLVTFPDRHYGGLDHACAVRTPIVLGTAGSVTITVGMTPNYDSAAQQTGSVSMVATGSETRVLRAVEGVELGDEIYAAAVSVGDGAAAATAQWTLDALIVPVERRQELVPV